MMRVFLSQHSAQSDVEKGSVEPSAAQTDTRLQSPHTSPPQSPEPLARSLPKVGFELGTLVMKHLLMSWDTALDTVDRRTYETNEMLASP